MILIILATLLLLGIAFYQVVQGLFSAMIMTILTILSAALAFNFYEPLAELFASRLGIYAHPIALLGVFVVPLYVLRETFDRLIKGNVVMGAWVDRIGGAAFGLVTALLILGVLTIVLQLLPFGGSMLSYRPYDGSLRAEQGATIRLSGRFTTGLMKVLSAGSLKPITKARPFGRAHEDLLLEAFCQRNRPVGGRASAPTNALRVAEAGLVAIPEGEDAAKMPAEERRFIENILEATPGNPLISKRQAQRGTKVVAVRAMVSDSARNEVDNWWRLPATQFRLVTREGEDHYPVGYLTWSGGRWWLNTVQSDDGVAKVGEIRVDRDWSPGGGTRALTVDWIYRLPADAHPEYVVFRRTAKAAMPLALVEGLPSPRDEKGVQIALGVMAKKRQVNFDTVAARWLQPELIQLNQAVPDDAVVRYPRNEAPPSFARDLVGQRGQLSRGIVAGAVSQIHRTFPRRTRLTSYREVWAPENHLVFQAQFKVQPGRADPRLRENLAKVSPGLILDDGRTLPHKGAYVVYRADGQQQVYFYFDADRGTEPLDAGFVAALATGSADIEQLGLYFIVPRDSNRRIEGLTLGLGGEYDFYPEAPLACVRR